MITPTPQTDTTQASDNHTPPVASRPTPRRPWQTPRLERAALDVTQFGGIAIFDGIDFDLTSIPL